jgi:DNA polymerase V
MRVDVRGLYTTLDTPRLKNGYRLYRTGRRDVAQAAVCCFLHTNAFQKDAPQYCNSLTRVLPFPTYFTPDLFNVALDMLRKIYHKGYAYKKCGVFLSRIVSQDVLQADLFGEYSLEREYTKTRLMCVVFLFNE